MKRIWLGILGALLLIGVSIWWIATHPPKDGPEYPPESLSGPHCRGTDTANPCGCQR